MIMGRSWRAVLGERKSRKGGREGVSEMDLMEQRNLFFDSTPSNPCVACILVFKPLARCLSEPLVRHSAVSFLDMIDEV